VRRRQAWVRGGTAVRAARCGRGGHGGVVDGARSMFPSSTDPTLRERRKMTEPLQPIWTWGRRHGTTWIWGRGGVRAGRRAGRVGDKHARCWGGCHRERQPAAARTAAPRPPPHHVEPPQPAAPRPVESQHIVIALVGGVLPLQRLVLRRQEVEPPASVVSGHEAPEPAALPAVVARQDAALGGMGGGSGGRGGYDRGRDGAWGWRLRGCARAGGLPRRPRAGAPGRGAAARARRAPSPASTSQSWTARITGTPPAASTAGCICWPRAPSR
jgi:hypothetical protein